MELHSHNTAGLKALWKDPKERQNAKIVMLEAIGQASEISVKVAEEIMTELDRILEDEEELITIKKDQAL
jgi:hypothetical protein